MRLLGVVRLSVRATRPEQATAPGSRPGVMPDERHRTRARRCLVTGNVSFDVNFGDPANAMQGPGGFQKILAGAIGVATPARGLTLGKDRAASEDITQRAKPSRSGAVITDIIAGSHYRPQSLRRRHVRPARVGAECSGK